MQLQFAYDPSIALAPAGFTSALAVVASYIDSLITNPIMVTIKIGWGEVDGNRLPAQDLAEAYSDGFFYAYGAVRDALVSSVTTATQATAIGNLPATDPLPGSQLWVPTAEAEALGLPNSNVGIVGGVGFSSTAGFAFDPSNRIVPGQYDFIGVAEHEITHALGRYTQITPGGPAPAYTPLDLFRYSAPGVHATSGNIPAYFSIDGGATALAPFDTASDPADWADSVQDDAFSADVPPGTLEQITPVDLSVLSVLGFQVNGSVQQQDVYTGSYDVAAAPGATITLGGIGQVSLSAAGNTVNVVQGADTIFAAPGAPAYRINNGGAVFFQAAASTGETADLFNGPGPLTVVGAANNFIVNQNTSPGNGAVMMAGGGNETLYDISPTNDQYWGSFGGDNDLIFAGSGSNILVAGNGADTLVGGGGDDVFYAINAQLIGALTHTATRPGQDVIYNAHPGDVLALTGFDSLYGAPGSGAAARTVEAALRQSGTVVLADGTTVSFVGGTGGVTIISS
jgi:hypothetical protein